MNTHTMDCDQCGRPIIVRDNFALCEPCELQASVDAAKVWIAVSVAQRGLKLVPDSISTDSNSELVFSTGGNAQQMPRKKSRQQCA